ncbi:MAG: winged helix-turn-helix domain-containing protein [Hyphomonadaceae bacterium]|nr:winged helix-turn-helix domain-containing protein [Hyphomonadaceae bacterium]
MRQNYVAGDIEVRGEERRVLVGGRAPPLGARAFDLLMTLIEHRDRVVGKAELMALVWPGLVVEENNLTVQISALRKALGSAAIATIAGRGYRFTLPIETGADNLPGRQDRPVIAVLAFDNQSGDADMQFFSDGISEEIIQRLARGANLGVIGRTTSFQFRGEHKGDVVERLQCTHVLDGAIRRTADNVRISAHLMDAASRETVWSQRYDRPLGDIFTVQDEIAESIASTLNVTFFSVATRTVDPAVYDLYLRSSPKAYAPNELASSVGLLEAVTERAPHFVEAWGRLAYLRSFLHLYLPFAERAASAERVVREASYALALDGQNIDALASQCCVMPPYGDFAAFEALVERLRLAPGSGDGRRYVGWLMRQTGRVREALEETQRAYRLDPLDSMSINLMALAYMATGRSAEAAPLFEDLVRRIPGMSFPLSSLLRARAFLQDWDEVDRLLALASERPLREFQDTVPFVRAKRDPTPRNISAWRETFEADIAKTGRVDVARLVYAAHLGLVDEAYRAAETSLLGPARAASDIMGPDGYRTALAFQADMPELRNDPRFPALCARLGLADLWLQTGRWPDCVDEVPYDFRAGCSTAKDAPREERAY